MHRHAQGTTREQLQSAARGAYNAAQQQLADVAAAAADQGGAAAAAAAAPCLDCVRPHRALLDVVNAACSSSGSGGGGTTPVGSLRIVSHLPHPLGAAVLQHCCGLSAALAASLLVDSWQAGEQAV